MATTDGAPNGVNPEFNEFSNLAGDIIEAKIQYAVKNKKVVVFGRSTCPFCIEITRTLVEQAVPFTYYQIDLFGGGDGKITQATTHEALKNLTNQKTLPYVYVNGNLLGGCDATKALISTGEFEKMLGSGPAPTASPDVDLEVGSNSAKAPIKTIGVDQDATKITGALLEFPTTVDGRVIRLVGFQVCIISTLLAILAYQKNTSWHWIAVGLLTDFFLRFYAGAGISPLGSIAMFAVGLWDLVAPRWFGRETGPVWGAGPPKQFAVSVGIFASAMIVVFQFTHVWPAATAFAAGLAIASFLEWALNFCAGCWVFGHAIRFGIVPDSVYIVHINTLPETKLTWEDFTKTVDPPKPEFFKEHFRDHHNKPTKIDLFYKTGKTDDWEREDFDYIKHSKISFFSSVIGVAAVPALFKFMSMSPRFQTSDLIWQVLTVLSLVYTVIFTAPYILKMYLYPRKIRQDWQHPMQNNAFTVPSMVLIVYAFLATGNYSTALARVLFWIGSSTAFVLSIIIVGNILSSIRHPGHLNGAWQMAPVGLYIAAVVGPIVDPSYTQVCYLFFGFASIMYITLFVLTFQNVAINYLADPRQRMFSAIWFAAPSVASIAWTVLTASGGMYVMDPIGQTLFYVGVSLALVNLWMVWRRFLWTDKFFFQIWAFGFPTAALAWAAVLYDGTVQTALTKILAVVCISIACVVCFVLTMRTFTGIARLKVFIPEHKWGPMSHLPLFQEAARTLLARIGKTTEALAEDPANARLRSSLQASWVNFTTINTFYSTIKRDICLPQIGDFFPGHQAQALANNEKMMQEQNKIDGLLGGSAGTVVDPAALKIGMQNFIQLCRDTYDHVEDHVRPVVRRYIPGPVQKKIMVDCWDDAPKEGWWATIPVVVQNLPMQGQRLTYIRAFLWAMPERCQQLGTMIALGVDPVTWYRLKHQLPEIIPRGESGWKKF